MPAPRTVVLLFALLLPASAAAQAPNSDPATVRVSRLGSAGPLRFEANRGQTDPGIRFLARGKGYTLFLTDKEAVFSLNAAQNGATLRISLGGAQSPRRIVGAEPLPGKSHYIRGSDSRRWITDVASFAKVRYEEVYPGIDLVYYGNQQQVEYDYVVAPGADPSAIRVRFAGAERITITDQGDLLLRIAQRDVRQLRPVAYQHAGTVRREIPARYELAADGAVGFKLGAYDPTVSVVIDPVLIYSTYLGGTGESGVSAVAADSSGAAYLAGGTRSTDFPTTPGALRETNNGGTAVYCEFCDAFVSKFDASGALVYSTFLGGHGANGIADIAVSPAGEAYVVGNTWATDFRRPMARSSGHAPFMGHAPIPPIRTAKARVRRGSSPNSIPRGRPWSLDVSRGRGDQSQRVRNISAGPGARPDAEHLCCRYDRCRIPGHRRRISDDPD